MAAFNAMIHEARQPCKHMLFFRIAKGVRSAYATRLKDVIVCVDREVVAVYQTLPEAGIQMHEHYLRSY